MSRFVGDMGGAPNEIADRSGGKVVRGLETKTSSAFGGSCTAYCWSKNSVLAVLYGMNTVVMSLSQT